MPSKLRALAIIVPAHNEEDLISACLTALSLSMDRFAKVNPRTRISATIVLDRCTDRTATEVEEHARNDSRFTVLEVDFENVGASRAAGIGHALDNLSNSIGLDQVWLACTDADTRVPEHWLEGFAQAYAVGADAVTGTVEPDREELGARLFASWEARYQQGEGHGHIHGANLGICAAAYRGVGGFRPMPAHEDVQLVRELRGHGYRVAATATLQVVTSGRLRGRLHYGFADYLAVLEASEARVG